MNNVEKLEMIVQNDGNCDDDFECESCPIELQCNEISKKSPGNKIRADIKQTALNELLDKNFLETIVNNNGECALMDCDNCPIYEYCESVESLLDVLGEDALTENQIAIAIKTKAKEVLNTRFYNTTKTITDVIKEVCNSAPKTMYIFRDEKESFSGDVNTAIKDDTEKEFDNLLDELESIECGLTGKDIFGDTQSKISMLCDSIKAFLLEKNKRYGDSALNPVRSFSKLDNKEQIKIRIDDKLSRINNNNDEPRFNDIVDLTGYLLLYLIAMDKVDWKYFKELLD